MPVDIDEVIELPPSLVKSKLLENDDAVLLTDDEKARFDTMEENAKDDQSGEEIITLLEAIVGTGRLNATAIRGILATMVAYADANNYTDAETVEAALDELFESIGGAMSGTTKRVILTRPGITVDVEYTGTDVPVLTGDKNSGYQLEIPDGTSWRVIDVNAPSGSAATSGQTFQFTVNNDNAGEGVPAGGYTDRAIAQIKDLGTGEILEFPLQERGIQRTETISTGSVTNSFTAIGAIDFAILFTR